MQQLEGAEWDIRISKETRVQYQRETQIFLNLVKFLAWSKDKTKTLINKGFSFREIVARHIGDVENLPNAIAAREEELRKEEEERQERRRQKAEAKRKRKEEENQMKKAFADARSEEIKGIISKPEDYKEIKYVVDLMYYLNLFSESEALYNYFEITPTGIKTILTYSRWLTISEAVSRYWSKQEGYSDQYTAQEKNYQLVDSLVDSRENFCGIGTRKVKLQLNKLMKKGVEYADLYRTALELEDVNISAKRYWGSYKRDYYDKKVELIEELVELCKKYKLTFGKQPTNNYSTSYIVYFDIPKAGQISYHTNKVNPSWPMYLKDWDGERNSTLPKLEKAISNFLKNNDL